MGMRFIKILQRYTFEERARKGKKVSKWWIFDDVLDHPVDIGGIGIGRIGRRAWITLENIIDVITGL